MVETLPNFLLSNPNTAPLARTLVRNVLSSPNSTVARELTGNIIRQISSDIRASGAGLADANEVKNRETIASWIDYWANGGLRQQANGTPVNGHAANAQQHNQPSSREQELEAELNRMRQKQVQQFDNSTLNQVGDSVEQDLAKALGHMRDKVGDEVFSSYIRDQANKIQDRIFSTPTYYDEISRAMGRARSSGDPNIVLTTVRKYSTGLVLDLRRKSLSQSNQNGNDIDSAVQRNQQTHQKLAEQQRHVEAPVGQPKPGVDASSLMERKEGESLKDLRLRVLGSQ